MSTDICTFTDCPVKISDLRVNAATDPMGIDTTPIFSWQLHSDVYGAVQAACQILVASRRDLAESGTGDLWDSGKMESHNHYDVVYAGKPLCSKTAYYWCVKAWDNQGNSTGFSQPARFFTGMLDPSQWQGDWIAAAQALDRKDRRAPLLRREFDLSKPLASAYVFVCGLGMYDLTINGQAPDDSVLNPAQSQYDQTVFYRTYDVTKLLRPGKNAVGVELGNGFYNEPCTVWRWQDAVWRDQPKLLLNLVIRYQDGAEETVVTDASWKVTSDGPTVSNSIYLGETFDARKQKPGWDCPGYDDSAWTPAQIAAKPAGKLTSQKIPPIRRIDAFAPKSIQNMGGGTYIIAAPEMVTGWIKLNVKAPKNTTVFLTYGEQLKPDGYLQKIGRGEGQNGDWWPDAYNQQDLYISDGTDRFFEPKFSYKGFEYVQIDHYAGELLPEDVVIYRTSNDIQTVADFQCANPQINVLHRLMHNTLLNNFQHKPTDTPVWEKNGWLGDANVALSTMMYQFDLQTFLPNFLDIMNDCFHAFGNVPTMVPNADWAVDNTPVWNTIFVFGVQELYDRYGQLEAVRQYYPDLKRFALKDIDEIRENGWVWRDEQLADWASPIGGTDPDVRFNPDPSEGAGICGTAFVYAMLQSMASLALAAGQPQDVPVYQQAMEQIRRAFNDKFYRPEQSLYDTGFWREIGTRSKYRQTSNLLPLAMGLALPEHREQVAARLAEDIEQKDCHADTGCVGTKFLLPVLSDMGYPQLAYRLLTQTSYPSWGYWLQCGATSAWEFWERSTRSMDHYFLGTFDEFLFSHIGGVREIQDGFRSFAVRPLILPELEWAEISLQTVRGPLKSAWRCQKDGSVTVEIVVPFGATADISLPAAFSGSVTVTCGEPGIADVSYQDGQYRAVAGSGWYEFTISALREELL